MPKSDDFQVDEMNQAVTELRDCFGMDNICFSPGSKKLSMKMHFLKKKYNKYIKPFG